MRLIDADVLFEKFKDRPADTDDEKQFNQVVRYMIKRETTIDAEPIKHGKWISRHVFGEDPLECSECGNSLKISGFEYCPYCGAKMDMGEQYEIN